MVFNFRIEDYRTEEKRGATSYQLSVKEKTEDRCAARQNAERALASLEKAGVALIGMAGGNTEEKRKGEHRTEDEEVTGYTLEVIRGEMRTSNVEHRSILRSLGEEGTSNVERKMKRFLVIR